MSREITEPKFWQTQDEALDYLKDQAGNTPVDEYIIERVITALVKRYKPRDKSLKADDFLTIKTSTASFGETPAKELKWVTLGRGQGIDLAKVPRNRRDPARSYKSVYLNHKARELDIFPGFVMDDAGMDSVTYKSLLRVTGDLESVTLLSDHVHPGVMATNEGVDAVAWYAMSSTGFDGSLVRLEKPIDEDGYKNSFRPCVRVNPLWVAGNGLLNLPAS